MARFLELTSKWYSRDKQLDLLFDKQNNKISDIVGQDEYLKDKQERIIDQCQISNLKFPFMK